MKPVLFRSVTGPRHRVIFAVATAMFFLMCHGGLGSSHALGEVALPNDGAQSHHMQTSGHNASASHGAGETKSHGDGLMYASVIVASALGALIFLSSTRTSIGFRFVDLVRNADFAFRKGLIPCRGPTLPSLQVYRL